MELSKKEIDYLAYWNRTCLAICQRCSRNSCPIGKMIRLDNLWDTYSGSNILFSSVSSVQWLSRVWLFATPWIAARQASLSITNSQSLLKLMSIKSLMPSSHLILCRPLLLPPIPLSIRVFSNESTLYMRWPKYWRFSFSVSPTNEHPGLISFRMDWLDLLAVQGTLKSLLQHHTSKESIFQCSVLFTVQLSHPYMTNGKTIALTRWTLVDKVMSLLFNMLSRLVTTFLPRSKRLLISWLQSCLNTSLNRQPSWITAHILTLLRTAQRHLFCLFLYHGVSFWSSFSFSSSQLFFLVSYCMLWEDPWLNREG